MSSGTTRQQQQQQQPLTPSAQARNCAFLLLYLLQCWAHRQSARVHNAPKIEKLVVRLICCKPPLQCERCIAIWKLSRSSNFCGYAVITAYQQAAKWKFFLWQLSINFACCLPLAFASKKKKKKQTATNSKAVQPTHQRAPCRNNQLIGQFHHEWLCGNISKFYSTTALLLINSCAWSAYLHHP